MVNVFGIAAIATFMAGISVVLGAVGFERFDWVRPGTQFGQYLAFDPVGLSWFVVSLSMMIAKNWARKLRELDAEIVTSNAVAGTVKRIISVELSRATGTTPVGVADRIGEFVGTKTDSLSRSIANVLVAYNVSKGEKFSASHELKRAQARLRGVSIIPWIKVVTTLGFVFTLTGFAIMTRVVGADLGASAGDAADITATLTGALGSFSTAVYTTLIGGVAGLLILALNVALTRRAHVIGEITNDVVLGYVDSSLRRPAPGESHEHHSGVIDKYATDQIIELTASIQELNNTTTPAFRELTRTIERSVARMTNLPVEFESGLARVESAAQTIGRVFGSVFRGAPEIVPPRTNGASSNGTSAVRNGRRN